MNKFALTLIVLLSASPAYAANEVAEDLGAAVGGAAGGAVGGNVGAAAGALAGKYGTRAIDSGVSNAIDSHFDSKDQDFANKTGITIYYPDRNMTITPQQNSSGSAR